MAFQTIDCSICPYILWRITIVHRPRCMDHHQKQSVCQCDVSKANISPVVRILTLQKAANLMGADLYNNLIRYFVTHLKGLRDVGIALSMVVQYSRRPLQQTESLQDEALLRYYAAEWSRYTTGANYINRLFTYLNRHWVKRERDEGRKAVYPVYTVNTSRDRRLKGLKQPLLPSACSGTMEEQSLHSNPTKANETCKRDPSINRGTTKRKCH